VAFNAGEAVKASRRRTEGIVMETGKLKLIIGVVGRLNIMYTRVK
jgi:hypothetical protein